MGKYCLHANSFIFYRIIIKVAGNQDRHKSLVEFDFGPNQTTHFGVTCPWMTKISHFWTEYLWNQLANLDQILCVASLGWVKGCIRWPDWPWHIGLRWAIVGYLLWNFYQNVGLCMFFKKKGMALGKSAWRQKKGAWRGAMLKTGRGKH